MKINFMATVRRNEKHKARSLLLALAAGLSLAGCGGSDGPDVAAVPIDPNMPKEVKFTFVGEADNHLQIGKVGILYGAAYAMGAQRSNAALPARVVNALKAGGGTMDFMLLGHHHGDHNVNSAEVQKLTGAKYYASAPGCDSAVKAGAACETIKGDEVIKLSDYVTLYPFRFVHGVGCFAKVAADGGIETLGYLLVAQTTSGRVSLVLTDSGSGSYATQDFVVNGVNIGNADTRMRKTLDRAGVKELDFMTVGPEGRFSTQVALFAPQYKPKTFFLTHHGGTDGSYQGVERKYDLLGGLAYTFKVEDSPQTVKVMNKFPDLKFHIATNYFEAYSIKPGSFERISNPAVKAAMGYPETGPGPLPKSPTNFRNVPPPSGIDCPEDDKLFAAFN